MRAWLIVACLSLLGVRVATALQRVQVLQQCAELHIDLAGKGRGRLRAGERVELRFTANPGEPPKPVIFLASVLDAETGAPRYVFHDVDETSFYFVAPEAVSFSRKGKPAADPGAATKVLEIERQRDATCAAHGLTNCVMQVRLNRRGKWDPETRAQRAPLYAAAKAAIYDGTPGLHNDAQEKILRDRRIAFEWGLSDQEEDRERLWRHLQSGRPATIGFASEYGQVISVKLAPGEAPPHRLVPAREVVPSPQPNPGHAVLAVAGFELKGKRMILIQDPNEETLRLMSWDELQSHPRGYPMRFLMVGGRKKSPTDPVTTMAGMLETRFAEKAAADFVRAHAARATKADFASLGPQTDGYVLIRRKRPLSSNVEPEVVLGKVLPYPGAPGALLIQQYGKQNEAQLVSAITVAEVYRLPPR